MRDLTLRGPAAGTTTKRARYYYVPDGKGGYEREQAVIGFDKPGAIGPFEMSRQVTYGPWQLDTSDERRDQ